MATLTPSPKMQFFDANGNPLVGGKLYTYSAGTTTPLATYTNSGGGTANANPVILDSRGEASVWLGTSLYYMELKTSTDVLVWTSDNIGGVATLSALAASGGSALIGFIQAGAGVVARTAQAKMRDAVSVKDFGAVGDGLTDDTTAIQAALTAATNVIVPIGVYLISSTINVPAHTKLSFQGGYGNASGSYPSARLLKASTMTTSALTIQSTGWVDGGGIVCVAGNTGDGVQLAGNSAKLSSFLVHGAGGVGVRVGTDDATNCNSCQLDHVTSQYNGGHGIYIHQGLTSPVNPAQSNTNAGAMIQCFAQHNGGDGIKIGRGWWWSLINCLTESNTGWGLNLSGFIAPGDTVAECRYAQVFGGDFNEGNLSGSLNLASYASCVYMATSNQSIVNTGTFSNKFGSGTDTALLGMTVTNDIVQGTANRGFLFSANPASAGMTSQLFNRYEEGNWTPTAASSAGTITSFGTLTGSYTHIGRQVTLKAKIPITDNGTGSGYIRISGVPSGISLPLSDVTGSGSAVLVSGKALNCRVINATDFAITNYDGTYPAATGERLDVTLIYFK